MDILTRKEKHIQYTLPLPLFLQASPPSFPPSLPPQSALVFCRLSCALSLSSISTHLQYQRFPILSPHFSPPSLHLFPPPPHSPRTNRLNIVPSSTLSFFLSFFPPNTGRASSSSPSPSISSDGGECPIHIRIHFYFILLLLLLPPALVAGILKGLDPFFRLSPFRDLCMSTFLFSISPSPSVWRIAGFDCPSFVCPSLLLLRPAACWAPPSLLLPILFLSLASFAGYFLSFFLASCVFRLFIRSLLFNWLLRSSRLLAAH